MVQAASCNSEAVELCGNPTRPDTFMPMIIMYKFGDLDLGDVGVSLEKAKSCGSKPNHDLESPLMQQLLNLIKQTASRCLGRCILNPPGSASEHPKLSHFRIAKAKPRMILT